MDIFVNDQIFTVAENATVEDVMVKAGINGQGFAIAVNESVIPRSQWKSCPLCQGDRIILIQATAGG